MRGMQAGMRLNFCCLPSETMQELVLPQWGGNAKDFSLNGPLAYQALQTTANQPLPAATLLRSKEGQRRKQFNPQPNHLPLCSYQVGLRAL